MRILKESIILERILSKDTAVAVAANSDLEDKLPQMLPFHVNTVSFRRLPQFEQYLRRGHYGSAVMIGGNVSLNFLGLVHIANK